MLVEHLCYILSDTSDSITYNAYLSSAPFKISTEVDILFLAYKLLPV